MNKGRWYPQLTKLHDGKVVAMSGYKYEDQAVELRPEMFDASNEIWTLFYVSAELAVPLYNGAHLIPFGDWKGQIFYDLVSFGTNLYPNPWTQAHRFKPDILNPEWHPVGTILPLIDKLRYRGNSVVFPFRSTDTRIIVLNIGGGQPVLQNTAEIIILGESSNPNWIPIENLSFNRHDAPSALFLAEGTLMVIGGGHDMETVLTPEYLDYSDPDPSNWKWYNLPDMEVPRKYHSVALLIPDGSVWVAGSRIYDDPQRWEFENDMERRIEIYKPGYFFDGIRPIITKAPININYGIENHFTLLVSLDDDPNIIIDSIVLINLPSVTHCFDCSQRYIILDFVKNDDGEYEVTPPHDSYIAQPGYYMLFVIKDKSQSNSGLTRLPSEALIVKLEL